LSKFLVDGTTVVPISSQSVFVEKGSTNHATAIQMSSQSASAESESTNRATTMCDAVTVECAHNIKIGNREYKRKWDKNIFVHFAVCWKLCSLIT